MPLYAISGKLSNGKYHKDTLSVRYAETEQQAKFSVWDYHQEHNPDYSLDIVLIIQINRQDILTAANEPEEVYMLDEGIIEV